MPKHDIARYATSAKERHQKILEHCLLWTLRWQFVSDRTLAKMVQTFLESNRPRIAYQLMREGWLKACQVPIGHRLLDGKQVYTLSEAGRAWCHEHLDLDSRIIRLHDGTPRPAWGSMQHLLDLQRIFLGTDHLGMLMYWSEPETRRMYSDQTHDLIPDMVLDFDGAPGLNQVWVEYERSPKNDLRLAHWVNLYAALFRAQDQAAHHRALDLAHRQAQASGTYPVDASAEASPPALLRVNVIVTTKYQRERYAAAFSVEAAAETYRLRGNNKLQQGKNHLPVAGYIARRVEVFTLAQWLADEDSADRNV